MIRRPFSPVPPERAAWSREDRRFESRPQFVSGSLLEGDGFEPSVPSCDRPKCELLSGDHSGGTPARIRFGVLLNADLSRGTDGPNPLRSSAEPVANLVRVVRYNLANLHART